VDDAARVRCRENACDLQRDLERLRPRSRRLQPLAERRPFDQLENEIVAVLALEHIVDAADVRMIELRQRARLTQETRAHRGAEAFIGVDDFQRDGALELLVPAAVNLSHPAGAEQGVDPDAADAAAGIEGHPPIVSRATITMSCT